MKSYRIFTITAIFLSLFSLSSSAQLFYGSLSAGMNLSQVDGDEKYGFKKVGFNAGPAVMWPFGKDKRWSLTMELLYSQVGSYARDDYSNYDSVIRDSSLYYDGYKLNLSYVQIPLLIHYTDKNFVAAGVGFLYGQLIDVKEWEDNNDYRGLHRVETTGMSNSDLQVLADVRLRIYRRLWFNLRYGYSILPIRTRDFIHTYPPYSMETRKQYNNVITFRLTYIFNEPNPKKEVARKSSQ